MPDHILFLSETKGTYPHYLSMPVFLVQEAKVVFYEVLGFVWLELLL